MPTAPDFGDYRDQKRKFTFMAHTVNTDEVDTTEVELPVEMGFIGVVQLKDSPVFRALFVKQSTPFEDANKAYNEAIDALVSEAAAEGVQVSSLEELQAWASGEALPEPSSDIIDFSEMLSKMREGESAGQE